jgi:hypothetical protein
MYRVEENEEYGVVEFLVDGEEIADVEEMYVEGEEREVDDNESASDSRSSDGSSHQGVQGTYFYI